MLAQLLYAAGSNRLLAGVLAKLNHISFRVDAVTDGGSLKRPLLICRIHDAAARCRFCSYCGETADEKYGLDGCRSAAQWRNRDVDGRSNVRRNAVNDELKAGRLKHYPIVAALHHRQLENARIEVCKAAHVLGKQNRT